ncbi:MAG: hypothetical protein ACOYNZ_11540 [Rhodoferax sp.]
MKIIDPAKARPDINLANNAFPTELPNFFLLKIGPMKQKRMVIAFAQDCARQAPARQVMIRRRRG